MTTIIVNPPSFPSPNLDYTRGSRGLNRSFAVYAATLNLIQFQEKRFKVYRPCETNTHPFSSRLDIIVLSITTELTARVFLRSFYPLSSAS